MGAECQESTDNAVTGTGAVPNGRHVPDDLDVQASEGAVQDISWAASLLNKGGDRRNGAEGLLDVDDQVVVNIGVKLHQEAAGGGHGMIRCDENPQGHGAGNLFGLHKIRREVLGDFSGHQRYGTAVGFGGAGFTDHVQDSFPDRAADVELAVARRYVDGGLPQISPHLPGSIRLHQNAAHRPLAAYLQGYAVGNVLQQ